MKQGIYMRDDTFIKLVSTGVNDTAVNNIENSLPFCYFLFSTDKGFLISINSNIIHVKKKQAVFINKSVPFSVLLNWGIGENGVERKDIIGVRIPNQVINEYNKKYLGAGFVNGIHHKAVDYLPLDFRSKKSLDLNLIDSLSITLPYDNIEYDSDFNHITEIKFLLLLSIIREEDRRLDNMLFMCSKLTISEKVADLIMSDYSKNWSNHELANYFNMSVSTLKKKMYLEEGAISSFITRLKMIEALRQLRRTSKPINLIASSLGYSSHSYFSSVFRRTFRIFPSDVRRRNTSCIKE
ncbi:helix-turn-helix transcriptional regulator [Hafnia paralvei]|uniref:helix-turn-helix transcriptional regulator n=1 Tax=Hafnia paralvei TaxID=546367 RepID=UPI001033679C|nr:AraC family transcriptional regulator [Hafnia paralvei]TBL64318.1 AraC family transcriptional regulator [Hafnia paralvei]